ncbi:hypothetical protein [Candidatus Tisiphia endosymbiont of Sialis lutaria]|uniref:hypothetical protein n=1 Tax=Candidatus Tisiphia endosymbiont of Sialis lutaria TaxID=2029164 RepID=UPI00312C71CF
MEFNRNKAIIGFLKANEEQKFTPIQIAEWLVKTYPEEVKKKAERSKNETLNNINDPLKKAEVMLEILSGEMHKNWFQGIQNQEPNIKKEDYPRRYYYTKETEQVEIEDAEKGANIKEQEVHLKLSEFLWQELSIYNMPINEKCSSNRKGTKGNKWLYPDLVGMEDLTKDWALVTKNCVKQFADKKAKLWSFEVKVAINSTNVRQSFFQALSNSSWAHYGYLVASSLVEGKEDTLRELEILAARHGIGFILLNIEEPVEKGLILIPVKERLEIDWDMANRLVKENKDFKSFIEEVDDFCITGKTKRPGWKHVNY